MVEFCRHLDKKAGVCGFVKKPIVRNYEPNFHIFSLFTHLEMRWREHLYFVVSKIGPFNLCLIFFFLFVFNGL